MEKKNKKWWCISCSLLMLSMGTPLMAQSVIFPQKDQPGIALAETTSDCYKLSNDLFSTDFVKQNGKLIFGGCDAMGLLPGTELFKIQLGSGTEVKASEMTLGEVRIVNLIGDKKAVKGSSRFDGKAIEADYTYGNLSIKWRAVLRNGSHYLRTEMDITANQNTAMRSITPMIYTVDNLTGNTAPVVVGNTRGALLANNKLFAGLETPMGINTSGSVSDIGSFSYDKWTDSSWKWQPGEEIPAGITSLGNFDATQIVGARGYLTFRESGEYSMTFTYSSGSHRLNIVGVDVVQDGSVVSSDYHVGYTGNAQSKNVYKVTIPKAGAYLVRYFCETKTEAITSSGTIAYNKKVSVPVIVYDLAPGQASKTNVSRVLTGNTSIDENETKTDTWKPTDWKVIEEVPLRITELGFYNPDVKVIEQPFQVKSAYGTLTAEFIYKTGNNGLSIVGVDLLDASENVVVSDYHLGFSGGEKRNNTYTLKVPYSGDFKLRYFCENKNEQNTSYGDIKLKLAVIDTLHLPAPATTPIQGVWSRNTTLAGGNTWNISAVVGLIAEGQARRSFLAYSERERAVPWRPFPVYISWYELNINRNNAADYSTNMTVEQCTDVVKQWNEQLFKKYNTGIEAFVWDDGWDVYGTWTFNKNFPNGFSEPDSVAKSMNTGIGGWLGPVGGYGTSGNYRRNYWSSKGGMQLSNPAYNKVFLDACINMIKSYDFRFFKFDGISAQFSSVGPDAGTVGEENAEAIIGIEQKVRGIKEDIFFNTTVGTWASPFWFRFTDAVWRQENDYGTIGNQGTDRERWITYRDRLVYQNFVQNSPLCPINTLMTHGFILSKFGSVSKDMDYNGIVRELRCAFACGSGMVELYNDYSLMNSINNGKLWSDLAECVKWQKENADVLPDIHWVGGNPWDGARANIYGWASWNGVKATLALRNPSSSTQTYKTTLREALDIPSYIHTTITLSNAFAQSNLSGVKLNEPIDIDAPLTIVMPGSSVFVYNGKDNDPITTVIGKVEADASLSDNNVFFDLLGRRFDRMQKGVNVVNGKKILVK